MTAASLLPLVWIATSAGIGVRVITPIGPFCPIRSTVNSDDGAVGRGMSRLSNDVGPQLAMDMARMQLASQMGEQVDVSVFRKFADTLEESLDTWRESQELMRGSADFQAREFYYFSRCHMERCGVPIDEVCSQMQWQVDGMRAMADGRPPPPKPPGDLDPAKGFTMPSAQPPLTEEPFRNGGREVFGSELVQREYESIVKEHAALIRMGERFGSFDPRGQLAFLDALEAIELRWDVFFSRASLMDALNPRFVEQTGEFIKALGLAGAEDMRALLRQAHDLMRGHAQEALARGAY